MSSAEWRGNLLTLSETQPEHEASLGDPSFVRMVNEVPDTLVSVAFGSPLLDALRTSTEAVVEIRDSDWALTGNRKVWHHFKSALRTIWLARRHKRLICCTVNIELFLIAMMRPLLLRFTQVEAFDQLIPRSNFVRRFWESR